MCLLLHLGIFLVVKNTFIFLPVFISSVPACVFRCIGISDYIHVLACVSIWGNVSPDLSVTEDGLFPPKLKLDSLACTSAQIILVKSLVDTFYVLCFGLKLFFATVVVKYQRSMLILVFTRSVWVHA